MSIEERFEEASKFYDNKEYDKAVPLLETLASEGHAEAQRFLGHCYYNSYGITKDDSKALDLFHKSAEQGNVEAQNVLGYAYRFGKGIAQNDAKAFEWFSKAAEQGHAYAQCSIGDFYYKGRAVEKDEAKALEWYNKAAEQGEAGALLMLGDFYYKGIVVSKDKEKAFELYSKSAKKGHAGAQFAVGNLYYKGAGVAQDENKAIEWYRKAAKKGHEGAKKRLAEEERFEEAKKLYDNDEYYKAVSLFESLADEGHTGAQFYLGKHSAFVEKDEAKAVEWFSKSAKQGYAEAQFWLGTCYSLGKGTTKDDVKSFEWYRKAAKKGHAEAQKTIAQCYYNGIGVAEDKAKTIEWMRKAAEQGHAEAQRILGQCYYEGGGVAKDEEKAIEWLRKAAEQGDEDAKNMLSEMNVSLKSSSSSVKSSENVNDESKKPRFEKAKKLYDNKEYDKAVPLLEALAEEGYAKAQYWLGCAYRLGNGVARDYVKSIELYRKAAKQGDEGYKKMIAKIKEEAMKLEEAKKMEEAKKLEDSAKSSEQASEDSAKKTTEPKKEKKKPTSGGMSCLLFLLWIVLAVGGAFGLGQLGWGWGILGFLGGALIGFIVFGIVYQQDDTGKAADAGTQNSGTAAKYFKSGLKKREAKNYDGALSDFNKAIELDPYGSSQAYLNRAQINYERYGDAKNEGKNDLKDNINSDMSRCVELDPMNWGAIGYWSRALDTFGLYDESKHLKDISEDNCEPLRSKGLGYAKEYNFDEAIKCFQRAKELNPIGTGSGLDCKLGGDHGEIEKIKTYMAWRENPNMFGNDYTKEIEFLEKVVGVYGYWQKDLDAHYRLAYLLATETSDHSKHVEAKNHYETIVNIDPYFKRARENAEIMDAKLYGSGGGIIGALRSGGLNPYP